MYRSVKIDDDFIDADEIFGPLPNFMDSFENYFVERCAYLLINCQKTKRQMLNKHENFDKLNENGEKINDFDLIVS